MTLKVGVCVGEASGDKLAAHLLRALRAWYPDIEVEGVVGPDLLKLGARQLYPMHRLSVMGFVDPLMRLPELLRLRRWLKRYFKTFPPDVFIGVDSPDFNLNLERYLRKQGIKTVHYVSPSVWAWRQGRIGLIKQATDLMLTLLPFEAEFYQQHQVPVCFTGHPAADAIDPQINLNAAKRQLGLSPEARVVAMLPGSRMGELQHLAVAYFQALLRLSGQIPNLNVVIPVTRRQHQTYLEPLQRQHAPGIPVIYLLENRFLAMQACDIALVTSGTATLEMMLHQKPMVVAYRTNWICYWIARWLVKVSHIALPNLLSKQTVVPELIQTQANPVTISDALLELIQSGSARAKQVAQFSNLQQQLRQNASVKAATAVAQLLGAST